MSKSTDLINRIIIEKISNGYALKEAVLRHEYEAIIAVFESVETLKEWLTEWGLEEYIKKEKGE